MAKGIFTYGETWTANYSFSDGPYYWRDGGPCRCR